MHFVIERTLINNKLFVFVDKCFVLTGPDMSNLDFIKKDGEKLTATHIVYAEGTYYITAADKETQIYATTDFQEYINVGIEEIIQSDGSIYYNAGIFLDSKGNIIVVVYKKDPPQYTPKIYICKTLKEFSEVEIVAGSYITKWDASPHKTFLVDDKIFFSERQYSLSGTDTSATGLKKYMYISGYFIWVEEEKNLNTNLYEKIIYRSRDGMNKIKYTHEIPKYFYNQYVMPINGKYGCIYTDWDGNCWLNIADDIINVGYVENQTIRVYDPLAVRVVLEYDGKTYLGTDRGVIYEFQLDYEGTIQRPDVAVIKTLAAREALTQSLQYTDECVVELKNYIDQKIQEGVMIGEDDSTEIEPSEKVLNYSSNHALSGKIL